MQRVVTFVDSMRPSNLATNLYGSPSVVPRQNALYTSHIGSLHTSGSWSEDPRASSSNHSRDGPLAQRGLSAMSGPSIRPPPTQALEVRSQEWRPPQEFPQEEHRLDMNRKRTVSRDFQRPYMKEMAAAHAENRDPVIQIPVCESGTVSGLKSLWHRAARLCARQTLNFKVRSYKGKGEYWMSQVQNIAEKLDSSSLILDR